MTMLQCKFTFQYIFKDSSNNKTTATLNVTVKEKQTTINQSSNKNNSTQTKSNNPSKPTQQQQKPLNKVFYIIDYNYDIASCKNATVSYMNTQIQSISATYGELQPYQEDGATVGYKDVFK